VYALVALKRPVLPELMCEACVHATPMRCPGQPETVLATKLAVLQVVQSSVYMFCMRAYLSSSAAGLTAAGCR